MLTGVQNPIHSGHESQSTKSAGSDVASYNFV